MSKAAREGERKYVTALFGDLADSMQLFAHRDVEVARKVLQPVLDCMMEAVHRFEGTVVHVEGDAIVALFGAPLALEDHAARGCYAALRMQQSVGRYAESVSHREAFPIRIRIGLNSGEVLIRSVGSDLRMEYVVVGQTTNIAARIEQMAKPGSTYISAGTLALADTYVQVNPLGPKNVKGIEVPLEVFELTGASAVRSRFRAAATRGLTGFVGRDHELDRLRQSLANARNGHGEIVAVIGDSGVGKSRLYWELTRSQCTQGCLTLESNSVSYGKSTSFLPVIDLLKSYFDIQTSDGSLEIREKVTAKLLALDRTLEPCLLPLLWLLGVPIDDARWQIVDAAQRRQQALESVRRMLLRESQVQPLIVVFEDLHWIDAETHALLDSLVDSVPAARVLLLVNYRPEYHHGWGSKSHYQQLRIHSLAPECAERLVDSVLGKADSLQPLKRLLIERTEGNPFFLEETVRSLVETKALSGARGAYRLTRVVQNLETPTTTQAMLAARIDRLSVDDKQLLQAASVIGKDIPYTLLLAVSDLSEDSLRSGVAHLQAAEFLFETRLFPDLEYTFKHALTQEVAYGSLLRDRRRELHAQIVTAIEAHYRDRFVDQIERLAHHAFKGELHEKAVPYLRQAAAKAAARSALPEARTWYEHALSVISTLPESRSTVEQGFEIRLELRTVLTQLGEPRLALQRLHEAESLAEQLDDDHRRARVCSILMTLHSLLGELDEAVKTGTRALQMAESLNDLRLRIFTTGYLEQSQYYRGEYGRVVELANDTLALLPSDWAQERFGMVAPTSIYARSWLLISLAELGRFGESAKFSAEAIRLAEATQHPYTVGLAYRAAGTFRLLLGDWPAARSLLDHARAVLREGNVELSLPATVASSAWALAQLGETSEALNRVREGERLIDQEGTRGIQRAWDRYVLGRTYLLLNRLDDARRLGERAVQFVSVQPGAGAHALHLLGDVTSRTDCLDADGSEIYYRRALTLAEPRGMLPLVAHCHFGLGRLLSRNGEREQGFEHFGVATNIYRQTHMRFWLQQAEAEMNVLV